MREERAKKMTVLDGATGTMLQRMGMPEDACTEAYVTENPDSINRLHGEYVKAGADAVYAPTFGANSASLSRHGYPAEAAAEICEKIASESVKNAARLSEKYGRRILVGGDMSPTGLLLKPYGNAEPEEVVRIYREQAQALLKSGVDFIAAETMISAAECAAALRAIREVSADIPILVTLTVNENGKTMNGDDLSASLIVFSQYNISGFGCNCSIGPDVVYSALRPVSGIAAKLGIPLIAKPNAGLPKKIGDKTEYPLTPEDMASHVEGFAGIGVRYIGGCCGTTPGHISAIADAVSYLDEGVFGRDVTHVDFDPKTAVASFRAFAEPDEDAEYVKVSCADELYDAMDEAEDILYLELEEGGADAVISEQAYITLPLSLRGKKEECDKVRSSVFWKTE